MSERIAKIKRELSESRAFLERVLDAVGSRWDVQVYADGAQWTVRQLLIHLADASRGNNAQMMGIAEGREIIPPDFDLNRYNKRAVEKRIEMTVDEARAALTETREALNAWLDTLDESVLERRGRHASLNILSIEEILNVVINHERDHARDIARVLGIRVEEQP